MELKPTFTLTFSRETTMKEIRDAAIRTILQHTGNNRGRTAELLDINPRTIRRRLGKKHGNPQPPPPRVGTPLPVQTLDRPGGNHGESGRAAY
jgi:hypothetical protein